MNNTLKRTVIIPYGQRIKYVSFVHKISSVVTTDGLLMLFVCNIPYDLHSYLLIEDVSQNPELIDNIISKYKLEITNEIGLSELFFGIGDRKYNSTNILPNLNKKLIQEMFDSLYFFGDLGHFHKLGYNHTRTVKRKKIFISYCHNDKNIVYDIVEQLESSGMNLWIDKKDISIGQHILRSIMDGIHESDLAVLFISEHTLNSNYSKMELENIMSALINKEMGWYIIKLDSIDPNEIKPGLNNYKYFDYDGDDKALTKDIINKIKSI